MIRDEFEKALRRFEEDFQKGKATKDQFDKLTPNKSMAGYTPAKMHK